MRRLIDALADDADFFVEHVQLTAVVFDNTDDVTIWATTLFDEELHFFHLGLQFQQLDLLLRLAGDRAEALQEEVAEALATVTEWPCLLEYTQTEKPPIDLDGVALKVSCTYPADPPFGDDDEDDDEELPEEAEDDNEDADYEASMPHNIFYLEEVFLRIEP